MRKDIKAFLKSALSLKQEDGPCLEWPFAKTATNGYGVIGRKDPVLAHMLICYKVHGAPNNENLYCAHSCNNKSCIRPSHLRWATRSENMQDKRKSLTSNYKLTSEDIAYIKMSTKSSQTLADKYKVSASHIRNIKTGHVWK